MSNGISKPQLGYVPPAIAWEMKVGGRGEWSALTLNKPVPIGTTGYYFARDVLQKTGNF